MFSALLRFILGGSSGVEPSIPVSKRRFTHIENIDNTVMIKSQSKIVRPPKFDRVTVTKHHSRNVLVSSDSIVKINKQRNIIKVRD